MADVGYIEFRNMPIIQYWMKISAQSLVQRCNTTTQNAHTTKNGTGSKFTWRHRSNVWNKIVGRSQQLNLIQSSRNRQSWRERDQFTYYENPRWPRPPSWSYKYARIGWIYFRQIWRTECATAMWDDRKYCEVNIVLMDNGTSIMIWFVASCRPILYTLQ